MSTDKEKNMNGKADPKESDHKQSDSRTDSSKSDSSQKAAGSGQNKTDKHSQTEKEDGSKRESDSDHTLDEQGMSPKEYGKKDQKPYGEKTDRV